jgi:hypothetical protein
MWLVIYLIISQKLFRMVMITQHGYHRNTKVKPEAVTAVTELVMMGETTPETC